MKKIFLIVIAVLCVGGLKAQKFDKISGDIDDLTSDSTVFMSKKGPCNGKTVTYTLVVKNLDALDATWSVGGGSSDLAKDKRTNHFESIVHSATPFTIDTTNVGGSVTGMLYYPNAVDTAYTKTLVVQDFPYSRAGIIINKGNLTQIDWDVYIEIND